MTVRRLPAIAAAKVDQLAAHALRAISFGDAGEEAVRDAARIQALRCGPLGGRQAVVHIRALRAAEAVDFDQLLVLKLEAQLVAVVDSRAVGVQNPVDGLRVVHRRVRRIAGDVAIGGRGVISRGAGIDAGRRLDVRGLHGLRRGLAGDVGGFRGVTRGGLPGLRLHRGARTGGLVGRHALGRAAFRTT